MSITQSASNTLDSIQKLFIKAVDTVTKPSLVTNMTNPIQLLVVFGLATALAYGFGFHLLFAHSALEAVYWGAYFLSTYVFGNLFFNFIKRTR